AGSGFSPMDRDHGNQRSRAGGSAGTVDRRRGERPRYIAPTVLGTFVPVAVDGGADPVHFMRQHRESAAGEGGGAEARTVGAGRHGRGTIPPDPANPDRKPLAGGD